MAPKLWSSKKRSAVAIRHVAFEDLGTLAPVLDAHGFNVSYCEAATDQLSHYSIRDADLVIVLGGPIGLRDLGAYPFLQREVRLIERRLSRGQPTLGIGLGAQLMTRALAGTVHDRPEPAIGWDAIRLTPEGLRSPLAPLGRADQPVLHWTGTACALPEGARRLASSDRLDNLAFSHGGTGLALQFHLEADPRGLEEWYVGHALALTITGIDIARLRREGRQQAARLSCIAGQVFGNWLYDLYPGEFAALAFPPDARRTSIPHDAAPLAFVQPGLGLTSP